MFRFHQLAKKSSRLCSLNGSTVRFSSTKDFELLHRSIVPTDHFQRSLPRLPIPPLEATCARYLAALEPILTSAELANTKGIVADFRQTIGQELDKELRAKDLRKKHTNYISESWFNMYLETRDSIVLNSNPFLAFRDDPRLEYHNQLIRSCNMIYSALRFSKTFRENILEPEIFHLDPEKSDTLKFRKFVRLLPKSVSFYGAYWYQAYPLDMSQYFRLFNSSRIPREKKDELFTDGNQKHLVVLRRGHVYVFDVVSSDGSFISPQQLLSNIKYIIDDKTTQNADSIGVLTSERRDVWAKTRAHLEKTGNAENLRLIDSAYFVVCLDDTGPGMDVNLLTKQFLYGDPANRWYDKSFQLIVNKDAHSAIHFEHAWGDGVAILRLFNELFKDSVDRSVVHPKMASGAVPAVRKIEFKLDDQVKKAKDEAQKKFDAAVGSLSVGSLECKKFGKNAIKKSQLGPDSMLQLALQVAFYKLYGQTVATYESCSTSAFKHGRTETVRPATMATKTFAEAVVKQSASKAQLMEMLKNCSNMHNKLTREAAMGQGFDRHLFGLRHMAQGRKVALFEDEAYRRINHNILSTSTLTSPGLLVGAFAPVVPDGFGVGYRVMDDQVDYNITSYPARNGNDFLKSIQWSLDRMDELIGK